MPCALAKLSCSNFYDSLGLSTNRNVTANKELYLFLYLFLSYLNAFSKIFSLFLLSFIFFNKFLWLEPPHTILNRSNKIRHLCLVLNLRWKAFTFSLSPLVWYYLGFFLVFFLVFFRCSLLDWGIFPCTSGLLRVFGCQIL